jgi:hypothetical protein
VRQEEKEKWKAEEGKLHVKWLEMDRAKVCRFPWHFHSFGADGLVYQSSICIYSIKPCRHLCCEGTLQITIIQRLCYTVRNVFMLQLRWILPVIGRTCLFGVREPTSPHLDPSLDRKDSVLSVHASLSFIPVITISRQFHYIYPNNIRETSKYTTKSVPK